MRQLDNRFQSVMLSVLLSLTSVIATQASPAPLASSRSCFHKNNNNLSTSSSSILNIRCGGIDDPSSSDPPEAPYNYASQQQQQQPPPQQMSNPNFQSSEFLDANVNNNDDPMYGYRETVEDRIDAWRRQQQQLQQTQSTEQAASPVDEQGRFKLFTHVSRASVSIFFFILMWRTVHHYELADATFGNRGAGKGSLGIRSALLRVLVVTPLVVLFLGEMMGAILGLTGGGGIGGIGSSNHATKKRLKGILNLHKFVELVMIVYNVFRLAIWPSKYVMREVYIGRTISNFFFLIQAQLYTKLSWDDVSMSTIGEGGYATESYYDDYMPENNMDMMMANDSSSWQSSTTSALDGEYYNNRQDGVPSQQQQYQQNYNESSTGWGQ